MGKNSQVAGPKTQLNGIKFLFAGTEKDDPNQLHAIMMFSDMAVLQLLGSDDELTEIKRQ